MNSALARQTALVLVAKLPNNYIHHDDNLWGEFAGDRLPPERIKKTRF